MAIARVIKVQHGAERARRLQFVDGRREAVTAIE